MTYADVAACTRPLVRLRELHLRYMTEMRSLAFVSALPRTIVRLSLLRCGHMSPTEFEHMHDLPELTTLALRGHFEPAPGADALAALMGPRGIQRGLLVLSSATYTV